MTIGQEGNNQTHEIPSASRPDENCRICGRRRRVLWAYNPATHIYDRCGYAPCEDQHLTASPPEPLPPLPRVSDDEIDRQCRAARQRDHASRQGWQVTIEDDREYQKQELESQMQKDRGI